MVYHGAVQEVLAHYPVPLPAMLAILGAMIGSFLNVVIVRLPEGQSLLRPPSHCPKCGYRIPPWFNIPVVSFLLLGGRCRRCREPIALRYPVVELLTALLFVGVGQRFFRVGEPQELAQIAASLAFVSGLIVVTFIDIDHFQIPDEVSVWGTLIAIALRPLVFDKPWWSGLVGAILGGGFLLIVRVSYELVRKREGMGWGDIKLLAMIGAFLGAGSLLPVILIGSTMGSVYGLAMLIVRQVRGSTAETSATDDAERTPAPVEPANGNSRQEVESEPSGDETIRDPEFVDEDGEEWVPPEDGLPFGPFLALGALTVLLFQPTLERWLSVLRA